MATFTRLVPFTHEVPVDLHRPDGGGDGSLVVALHGLGSSAELFARIVLPSIPDGASMLIPQAPLPFQSRTATDMRQGNGWYVYTGESEPFLSTMRRAEDWLLRVLDATLADYALDAKRVSLLGFSQGGYLAAYMGLRHAPRFRRLVVASARIKHEVLADDARRAAESGLRVLQVHGADDADVAPDASRDSAAALAAVGLAVDFRTYPGGHAVLRDEACRADVRAFLAAGSPSE